MEYSRDLPILRNLGYADIDEESAVPNVPCVIIYPTDGTVVENPFVGMPLKDLCKTYIHSLSRFYKINVPLPVMASQ